MLRWYEIWNYGDNSVRYAEFQSDSNDARIINGLIGRNGEVRPKYPGRANFQDYDQSG